MIENIQEIFTDRIDDPSSPMRSELDRAALFELADNIKQNGLINPITVRPVGDRYEVVAGHRRLSACKIAGLIKLKCVVRELSDNEVFAIKAAENLERADVDPVDEANFIKAYITQTDQTISQVAKALRRSVAYVETRLMIGLMPDYMQTYIKHGDLKLGAALALVQITDDVRRHVWVDMAVRDGVSVAQAEYWLHGWLVNQLPGGSDATEPPGGFVAGAPQMIMFECAVDGKKYDARLFRTLMVYEGNLSMFNAIVEQLRLYPTPTTTPPDLG